MDTRATISTLFLHYSYTFRGYKCSCVTWIYCVAVRSGLLVCPPPRECTVHVSSVRCTQQDFIPHPLSSPTFWSLQCLLLHSVSIYHVYSLCSSLQLTFYMTVSTKHTTVFQRPIMNVKGVMKAPQWVSQQVDDECQARGISHGTASGPPSCIVIVIPLSSIFWILYLKIFIKKVIFQSSVYLK